MAVVPAGGSAGASNTAGSACSSGSGAGRPGCGIRSAHTVSPCGTYRAPQLLVNCATRNRPRPPSSVAAARRMRGEVLLRSETSQISESSHSNRRPTGPRPPYRTALVTSSLTTSPVL
ncbi:hypothetical protein GCM10010398_35360 [Streptomyces fimbriatus]